MSNILGIYSITIPNYGQLFYNDENESKYLFDLNNTAIKFIVRVFDKYKIEYKEVDSIEGDFDLNRCYIETSPILLDVQYNGALPIQWTKEEKEYFRTLNYNGEIITIVHWVEKDKNGNIKYILNH